MQLWHKEEEKEEEKMADILEQLISIIAGLAIFVMVLIGMAVSVWLYSIDRNFKIKCTCGRKSKKET